MAGDSVAAAGSATAPAGSAAAALAAAASRADTSSSRWLKEIFIGSMLPVDRAQAGALVLIRQQPHPTLIVWGKRSLSCHAGFFRGCGPQTTRCSRQATAVRGGRVWRTRRPRSRMQPRPRPRARCRRPQAAATIRRHPRPVAAARRHSGSTDSPPSRVAC